MNTKPIMLATDGSPSASEATFQAIELARAFDAELVIVSVDHPMSVGGAFYGYADLLVELRKVEHERIEGALSEASAAATAAGVDCDVVHGGPELSVAEQICRLATDRGARLIVIGAHGWSPVRRVLHGSVSTAVVHEATCPVLVVPAGAAHDALPTEDGHAPHSTAPGVK